MIDELNLKIKQLESRVADLEIKIADLESNSGRKTSTTTAQKEGIYSEDSAEDDKYEEAKRMVINSGMASVSMLNRGLSVGYARAGKLIDQLERNGVIGPHQGAQPRDVLISSIDK